MTETRITRFQQWLAEQRGRHFASNDALRQWSVDAPQAFQRSLWDYFQIESPTPPTQTPAATHAPGASGFEAAQVNYARQVLRHADAAPGAGQPAILFRNEVLQALDRTLPISWPELRRQVASFATHLRDLGVQRSDRVAAYLPDTPVTAVAFLACASIGAVWSVCSPDMAPQAVLARLRQFEPKVLLCCDGCVRGGVHHDLRNNIGQIVAGLPSLREVLFWPYLDATNCPGPLCDPNVVLVNRKPPQVHDLRALLADDPGDFEPEWLAFDHPLQVVYTDDTTAQPKPIVHSHGSSILEGLKRGVLRSDLAPNAERPGAPAVWQGGAASSMWPRPIDALLDGMTICLYDGQPAGTDAA